MTFVNFYKTTFESHKNKTKNYIYNILPKNLQNGKHCLEDVIIQSPEASLAHGYRQSPHPPQHQVLYHRQYIQPLRCHGNIIATPIFPRPPTLYGYILSLRVM